MAIQAGAVNYLTKPFAQEDLTAKIMESLGLGGM
jgi:DNA-binding response OmpR family regulator